PAAVASASAQRSVGDDEHVPDFGRAPVGSAVRASAEDEAAADARAERDAEEVAGSASASETVLAPRCAVRVVVEGHGKANGVGDDLREVEIAQARVRSVEVASGRVVDEPGGADADAFDLLRAEVVHELLDLRNQVVGVFDV